MSNVYGLRKKAIVNYSSTKKKNIKKAEEILIETGLLDESSELKLNLSLEEPLVDVFGTEQLQQNEQN